MGYFDVLKLPLKTFWALNRQIARLRAEEDVRSMANIAAANSSDGYKQRIQQLQGEIGQPVGIIKKFDEAAFQRLKGKFGQGIVGNTAQTEAKK